MKKIISLFMRNYTGNRQVYDELVPGAEWVANGEGIATAKMDGTSCMVRDGCLYKRYDRKLTKSAHRRYKRRNVDFVPQLQAFKPAPPSWEAAEPKPNLHTGHWPGWVTVDLSLPENKYYKEAFDCYVGPDCTCELVGPKIQGNPHRYNAHHLLPHGSKTFVANPPRTFEALKAWLEEHDPVEGIVWHHNDGRMVKIKRRDFGLDWPVKE